MIPIAVADLEVIPDLEVAWPSSDAVQCLLQQAYFMQEQQHSTQLLQQEDAMQQCLLFQVWR